MVAWGEKGGSRGKVGAFGGRLECWKKQRGSGGKFLGCLGCWERHQGWERAAGWWRNLKRKKGVEEFGLYKEVCA